jgi:hypothetical protein
MFAVQGFGAGAAEAPKKRGRGRLPRSGKKARAEAVATPCVPRRWGRPLGSKNKKKLAAAAPATAAAQSAVAAAIAGPSRPPLVLQPWAYSSVKGYVTFLVLMLSEGGVLLRLPAKFVEAMEGQELAHAVVQECSGGQATYEVLVYYDGEVKFYFRDGWPRFFADYYVEEGWFLLCSRCSGTQEFFVRVIDGTLCRRSFSAWA